MNRIVRHLRHTLTRHAGGAIAPLAARLLRLTSRKVGVVLTYHRIDVEADPAAVLVPVLDARVFVSQLRHVAAHYRVVPASEITTAAFGRRRGEPFPVALTFDDDLQTHVTLAAPELEARGLRGTFFLTGTTLTGPKRFWWQALEDAPPSTLPELAAAVGAASADVAGIAAHVEAPSRTDRVSAAELLERTAPPRRSVRGLATDDVRRLAEAGHEIGFHTRDHDNLLTLTDDERRAALHAGRAELAEAAASTVAVLAYPHGGADAEIAARAREAGYAAAFTTAEGAVTRHADVLRLPRVDASFRSAGHLALQLLRHCALPPRASPASPPAAAGDPAGSSAPTRAPRGAHRQP